MKNCPYCNNTLKKNSTYFFCENQEDHRFYYDENRFYTSYIIFNDVDNFNKDIIYHFDKKCIAFNIFISNLSKQEMVEIEIDFPEISNYSYKALKDILNFNKIF